jgi:hypothetical protein
MPKIKREELMVGQLRQRGERRRRRRRVLLGGAVAVLALVGHDQHRRVAGVALHVLTGGASAHRAALVVPPAYPTTIHQRTDSFIRLWVGLDRRSHRTHRGYGDPLMGFCPYLRHEYSSAGMSATFGLIAGTRIVRFTRCFLRIQQIHLVSFRSGSIRRS